MQAEDDIIIISENEEEINDELGFIVPENAPEQERVVI